MSGWQEWTLRATAVLLVTSVVLIGPSLAGMGASLVLTLALVGAGFGFAAVRPRLASLPTMLGHDLGEYGQDLWLGVLLGGVALVFFPAATPAELQTLGGLAGFAGMMNYFLRPVYAFLYSTARSAHRSLTES